MKYILILALLFNCSQYAMDNTPTLPYSHSYYPPPTAPFFKVEEIQSNVLSKTSKQQFMKSINDEIANQTGTLNLMPIEKDFKKKLIEQIANSNPISNIFSHHIPVDKRDEAVGELNGMFKFALKYPNGITDTGNFENLVLQAAKKEWEKKHRNEMQKYKENHQKPYFSDNGVKICFDIIKNIGWYSSWIAIVAYLWFKR